MIINLTDSKLSVRVTLLGHRPQQPQRGFIITFLIGSIHRIGVRYRALSPQPYYAIHGGVHEGASVAANQEAEYKDDRC